jgi:hypothetical protein
MKRVKPRNAVTVTPGAPLRKTKQQKRKKGTLREAEKVNVAF